MKQNVTKFSKLGWLFYGAAAFVAMLLPSCRIGLGEAVDTARPEISVDDSIVANTVYKDAFELFGICKDDDIVEKVRVALTNNETGEGYLFVSDPEDDTEEMEEELKLVRCDVPVKITRLCNEKGEVIKKYKREDTWSITLNEKSESGEFLVKDGKYTATAYALDRVDRKFKNLSNAGRAIIVDNTAPLFLLGTPSLSQDFGGTFKIVGRVSDDNAVEKMIVDFYETDAVEGDEPIATWEQQNIAPTVEVNVAIWKKEGDLYHRIYGSNNIKNGFRSLKCKITLIDEAGNTTSSFYMDEDAEVADFVTTKGISVTDLYHIKNGTYVSSADRAVSDTLIEEVKAWLMDNEKLHKEVAFRLNPEASPKYSLVGGYAAVKTYSEAKKNEVLNGDSILVQVDAGRDGNAINQDSIGIDLYVIEKNALTEADDGSSLLSKVDPNSKITVFKPLVDRNGNTNITEEEKAIRALSKFAKQETSYTITAVIDESIKLRTGLTYLVVVTGFDSKKVEFDNLGDEYGFFLTAKGMAPTLTLTSPKENTLYLNKEGEFVVSGTTSHEEGIPVVKITVQKNADEDGSEIPEAVVFTSPDDFEVKDRNFELKIKPADFIKKTADLDVSAQYDVSIVAEYGEFASNEIIKSISYDVDKPYITNLNVLPVVDMSSVGGTEGNINGTVKISGSFNDAFAGINTDSLYWILNDDPATKTKIARQQNWEILLDTLELTDISDLILEFLYEDKAGNKGNQYVLYNEATSQKYLVNQESDKPIILPNGLEELPEGTKPGNGKNVPSQGELLTGTITDDDGLSKITISCISLSETNKTGDFTTVISGADLKDADGKVKKSYDLKQNLPTVNGTYTLTIEAEDTNETPKVRVWKSLIKIMGRAPELSDIKSENTYVTKTGNGVTTVTINSTVSGESETGKPLLIKVNAVNETDDNDWTEVAWTAAGTDYDSGETADWTYVIPGSMIQDDEGTYTLYFKAFDFDGKSSSVKSISYTVDNTLPEMKSFTVPAYVSNPSVSIEAGTVNPQDTYFYQILPASEAAPASFGYADIEAADSNWIEGTASGFVQRFAVEPTAAEISEGVLPEGEYKLYTVAMDSAKNTSLVLTEDAFTADLSVPVISNVDVTEALKEINSTEKAALATSPAVISAKITGTVSGFEYISLYKGAVKVGDLVSVDPIEQTYKYEIKDDAYLADGDNKFTIKAKNKAGREVSAAVPVIVLDETLPVYKSISVTPKNGEYVNGKVTVTVSLSDNKKLAGPLTWNFGADLPVTVPVKAASSDTVSFEVDTNSLPDGNNTLNLSVKDAAGNTADKNDFVLKVDQSTDKPVFNVKNGIEENRTAASITTATDKNVLKKKDKIEVEVSDDDGLASVTLKYRKAGSSDSWTPATHMTGFNASTDRGVRKTTVIIEVLEELPEGKLEVLLEASDIKHDSDAWYSNKWETVIGITAGAPTITIDETTNNKPASYVSNAAKDVIIKGSVTGGETVVYTKTVKVGSAAAVSQVFTPNAEGNFTHTISETGAADANTTVTVTYSATNAFGQSADPKTWTYTIDNEKPAISSILVASEAYNADKWRKNDSVNFSGTWTEDGSGIAEIYYWVTNTTADPGTVKDNTMSAELKGSVYEFNDNVYNFANGSQYVHFKAIDNVGNLSNDVYYKINVDNKAPVLTLNKANITDGKLIVSDTNLESSTGVQISGTLEEDISYISTTKAITVYEGADTTGTVLASKAYLGSSASEKVNGTKEFSGIKIDPSKLTKENDKYKENYTITVVGLDHLENSSQDKFVLVVDTEDPEVTIDAPAGRTGKNSIVDSENPVTIRGKASDNIAVSYVYYQIKTGNVSTKPAKGGDAWTRLDASSGQWEAKLSSVQEKGTYTVFAYSEDKSGKTSEIESSVYDIDNGAPEITLKLQKGSGTATVIQNTSGTEEVVSEDSFTLSVEVKDDYKLGSYTLKVDGVAVPLTQVTANKEYKATVSKTTDKVYEISVEAVDVVGKTTRASRKIKLDHTGPVINFTSPDLTKWQKEERFDVKGIVSDAVSGVDAIYYTTEESAPKATKDDFADTKWKKLTTTSTWSVSLENLEEGENGHLYVAAVDKAGNFTVETKGLMVDKTAPEVALYKTQADAESPSATKLSGAQTGKDSITFYIKATDKTPGSGIASVKVNGIDATLVTGNIYKYTVAKEANDTVKETCNVEVTDGAGLKATASVAVTVDAKAPVVTKVSPSKKAGDYINGTINLTFNAQDDTGLGGTYSYAVTGTEVSGNGTFTAGTVYENITIENFDTTSVTTTNAEVDLVITLTDAVGNTETSTTTLKIDQATDKPKFEASNAKGADYADNVFGLGNWTVGGKVSDDDGLGDVKVKFVPQTGATVVSGDAYASYKSILADTSKNRTSANISIPVNNSYNGKYDLYVQVFDNNTTPIASEEYKLKIAVDNSAPEIRVESVNGKDYSAKMFVPTGFNVELTAYDSNGVKDVRVKGAASPLTPANGKYTDTISGLSSGNEQNRVYVVTDNYNRQAEKEIIFNVDTTAPDVTPGAFKVTGGKKTVAYADGIAKNWFSSASIAVSAEKSDSTVPVTDVNLSENATYKLTGDTTAESSFEISRNSTASPKEGTMNNNRSVNNGKTHFLYTFFDEAGNSAKFETDVYVDNVAPVLGAYAIKVGDTTLTSSSIINAESVTVEIAGTDATSGITQILIGKTSGFRDTDKVNNAVTISTTAATTTSPLYGQKTLSTVKITVPTANLTEGNNELFVRLIDAAGNASVDQSIGTFTFDKTAPAVEIKSHENNAVVNGTITLSGSVSDSNIGTETKPVLYIDGTKVTNGVTARRKTTAEWEVSGINTVGLTDNTAHTFAVTFEDLAGNVTAHTGSGIKNLVSLMVNQDTDRPEIKLTNLTAGKTLNVTEITGSITDDDSVNPAIPAAQQGDFKVAVITSKGSLNDNSWKAPKEFNGTTFTVDVADYFETDSLDNEYKIFFQLKDAHGKAFSVKEASSVNQPKLKDENDGNKIEDADGNVIGKYDGSITLADDGSVSFAIDREEPSINNIWISTDGKEITAEDKVWEEFSGNTYYGGTKLPSAMIKIEARDEITTDPANLTVTVEIQQSDDADGNSVAAIVLEDDDITYNNNYHYATLDFSSYTDGLLLIYVKAADDSGHPAIERRNVSIDNTPPNEVHKSVRPDSSTEATATVTMTGTVFDDGEGVAKMEYCIPTRKLKTDADPVLPTDADSDTGFTWISENVDNASKLTRTSNSWTIAFTDLATDESTINENYAGYTTDDIIYNLPVWFKITDTMGNIRWDKTTLRYNPDADRPKAEFTYPKADKEVEATGKKYVVIGGNIEFNGIATDNDGIDSVYLQYDVDGDGDFDTNDYNWLNTNKLTVLPDGAELKNNWTFNGNTFWGVKATGKASWSSEFNTKTLSDQLAAANKSLEVTNDKNPGTNKDSTLNVRVCAVDTDDYNKVLVSAWTELHISLNDSKPQFSKFKLVQYPDASHTAAADVLQELDYTAGMYLNNKGYWRLEGNVRDQQGIKALKLKDGIKANYVENVAVTTAGTGKVSAISTDPQGYNIMVPITETVKFTIEATDNSVDNEHNTRTFNINVDAKAPSFMEGDDEDDLVLHRDSSNGSKLSGSVEIVNSNGLVSIFSKAKDEGSGFDKAMYYVVRRGDGTNTSDRIYNVMEAYGSDRMQNRFAFTEHDDVGDTELVYGGKATPNVFINADELPVVKAAIKARDDNSTLTVEATDIATDKNIREFGYLYIGGAYHLIKSITGSGDSITVVFDGDADKEKFNDYVYFVYGTMAVDHTGESLNEDGTIADDDGVSVGLTGKGDGMLESMVTLGTETTWSASFDSTNIPDGPLEVHVVVFDKAGNARHGNVTTKVTNNKPRIARVTLGTDLDGSGEIEASEKTLFYAKSEKPELTKTVNGQTVENYDAGVDKWTLDAKSENGGLDWKIKKDLSITPEFVGGTGAIHYYYSPAAGKTNLTSAQGTDDSTSVKQTGTLSRTDGKVSGTITITNDKLLSDTDDGINTYRFSFWDETEETTPGSNSSWCILNAQLFQDIVDSTRPEAFIHPFFWHKKGGNATDSNVSAYNSIQWDANGNALGHIELEADITDSIQNAKAATTGTKTLGNDDPKVSGKIVIRGSAYDETKLVSVTVTSSDTSVLGSGITASRAKTGNVYSNTWGTGTSNGNTLTVETVSIGQKGHLVNWTLEVDTEKVAGIVKPDVYFYVTANDGTGGSTEGSSGQAAYQDTYYYSNEEKAEAGKFYTSNDFASAESSAELVEVLDIKDCPTKFEETDTAGVYKYKIAKAGTATTNRYKMDVVPYVSEVVTRLAGYDGGVAGKYSRSSLGHYPVQSVNTTAAPSATNSSETVTLKGFNLTGANATVAVQTGTTTINAANVTKTAKTTSALSQLSFSASNLKTANLSVTVNGIPVMNNINGNDKKGTADSTGDGNENCYNMQPNKDNNNNLNDDLYFDVWDINDRVAKASGSNKMYGLNMDIGYGQSLIRYAYVTSNKYQFMGRIGNTNNSAQGTEHDDDYLSPYSVSFHVLKDGTNTYATFHGGEENAKYHIFKNGAQGKYIKNIPGYSEGMKDVVHSPVFASGKSSYFAYYDKIDKQIKFYTIGQIDEKNTSDHQVIASSTMEGRNIGPYVSLAVAKNGDKDVVCAVWYDLPNGKLLYSYKADPTKNLTTAGASGWSTAKPVFGDEKGGEYAQIKVDENGGIHVAGKFGGKLMYGYKAAYNTNDAADNGGFTTCTVDYGDAGNNLTMDVALSSGKPVVTLGYLSSNTPKYAKTTDGSACSSGVDSDNLYRAGNTWDISFVPVRNKITLASHEKVNVGLWKTTKGILTNSTATASSYTAGGASTLYGNGTNNGVLLYLTDGGENMESAQRR
ncbi:MAG: hypothetical protein MJ181_03955 [Treponema sp.]|nr:hypothetical protein [Treponema sp.]